MSDQNLDYLFDKEKQPPEKESQFKKEPKINVIGKEEFEERIGKVFEILWRTLARSFGPYGAPTIICSYPDKHVTKDGYTIMKHLSMDASETLTDQSIADLASDICGRLNYVVGDGTTSAIIATRSIYQAYMDNREELVRNYVLPRDVIHIYDALKTAIIAKLQDKVHPIQSLDREELTKNIEEVVFISSNGDEELTKNISMFYHELGSPSIICSKSPDGRTKATIVNGYQYELSLTDKKYINSDNDVMELDDCDVIIFSTKVNKRIYEKILVPLNYESQQRGRHLVVCAPTYDEMLMSNIKKVFNAEFKAHGDINMVLCVYKSFGAQNQRLINDFSILMNTPIIDRTHVDEIIEKLSANEQIYQVFNIDERKIEGIKCMAIAEDKSSAASYVYGVDGEKDLSRNKMVHINDASMLPLIDHPFDLGFVHHATIGMSTSLFSGFEMDENSYRIALQDAQSILDEMEAKYARLGTFNIETYQAQRRLYALQLKMGLIEIGGASELSTGILKDAADDAVRAAASAFKHGVVLGCNTTLLRVIYDLMKGFDVATEQTRANRVNTILTRILFDGFFNVYKTVLSNAFDDVVITRHPRQTFDITAENFFSAFDIIFDSVLEDSVDKIFDATIVEKALEEMHRYNISITVQNVIVMYSILAEKVFDISNLTFSTDVINSAQTDQEVLIATIDLMSLLISGNQMVVTGKRNWYDM